MNSTCASAIEEHGYALLRGAFTPAEATALAAEIEAALAQVNDEAVALRNRAGVFGARNVLEVAPAAAEAWKRPLLIALLKEVLGNDVGLVRGLYFDKPPARSWSLPWHQDLTIAVVEHGGPSRHFAKPTIKAGVPHVEASAEILQQMLTLRIHLDDVTDENGPLEVLPGTHRAVGASSTEPPTKILAGAGDVLAMRPLLLHASGPSQPGTTRHRRILHLEFAGRRELPDGYQWHTFRVCD